MRVVLDTNILVSTLLTPGGVCARLLRHVAGGALVPLFDDRMLAEASAVLTRFASPGRVRDVLDSLRLLGERVETEPVEIALIDEGDRPFVEVAICGSAAAIVTGNAKHFPSGLMPVLSPRALLDALEAAT